VVAAAAAKVSARAGAWCNDLLVGWPAATRPDWGRNEGGQPMEASREAVSIGQPELGCGEMGEGEAPQ